MENKMSTTPETLPIVPTPAVPVKQDPKVSLPPGLQEVVLTEAEARAIRELLDDPAQVGVAGTEMLTADPSCLGRKSS
jgi:hypothetical protein